MRLSVIKAHGRVLMACLLILFASNITFAAIGVYNFSASKTSPSTLEITYRLNCPGTVTIDILNSSNSVISVLGPFAETRGVQTHQWQADGPVGVCKARITATCTQDGEPGKLVKLFGGQLLFPSIRGVAVDRYPDSPGYGTIYVTEVYNNKVMAYYADGSAKAWSAQGANGNILPIKLAEMESAPWGLGVDQSGNIYVASKANANNKTGVKVFDHNGNELYHIFPSEKQSIYWLEGVATDRGLEVYETIKNTVRVSSIVNPSWSTIIGPLTNLNCEQICFEAGGNVCYVACTGNLAAGPDVRRYIRQPDASWLQDTNFNTGLSEVFGTGNLPASRYVTGVSCNSYKADSSGTISTVLWISLSRKNGVFGGNIVRMNPCDPSSRVLFAGYNAEAGMIAVDAVGNVAMDTDTASPDELRSGWGQYAVPGETNTDVRTTNSVVLGASDPAQSVTGICECHAAQDNTLVRFDSAKPVTAVFDGSFYIQELERTCGIKVECDSPVEVGSAVKVSGMMATKSGERVLVDAQLLP